MCMSFSASFAQDLPLGMGVIKIEHDTPCAGQQEIPKILYGMNVKVNQLTSTRLDENNSLNLWRDLSTCLQD